jgi:ribonuclease Z
MIETPCRSATRASAVCTTARERRVLRVPHLSTATRTGIATAVALLLPVCAAAQPPAPGALRITFLGTAAGPAPAAELAGTATLVEFGDVRLLIDAGRGAAQRLQLVNVNPGELSAVLLTHLHSDHTVGLPELWLSGWWRAPRRAPLELHGPEGTRAMAAALERAWSYDVGIRSQAPERLPVASAALRAFDVEPGLILDRGGVRVTALPADHGPVRAYGYRVDAGGHSVVFSGDDRASAQIAEAARGVDVFVHSVSVFSPAQLADTTAAGARRRAVLELLGTPEQVGPLFARAQAKLAVYYHYGRDSTIVPRTRAVYTGPLELAEDLMSITIGDRVAVDRRPVARP